MSEPTITRNDDGIANLNWTTDAHFTPVAREVLERYVETHNAAVRMRVFLAGIADQCEEPWAKWADEAIGGWTP